VRVVEYEVPDRDGDGKNELITLITTIVDAAEAPGAALAEDLPPALGARARKQAAQDLPARARPGAGSRSPDMAGQESYG